jgi:hypothetical protein
MSPAGGVGERIRDTVETADRVLVVVAGPNGAGKSTFVDAFLRPNGLHVINPDQIREGVGARRSRQHGVSPGSGLRHSQARSSGARRVVLQRTSASTSSGSARASVDGSLVGDRPQGETFQLPPQLPRSREIAKIPKLIVRKRSVRDRGVGGSNPLAPTNSSFSLSKSSKFSRSGRSGFLSKSGIQNRVLGASNIRLRGIARELCRSPLDAGSSAALDGAKRYPGGYPHARSILLRERAAN